MARKPRIHYPGAFYHVMLRGNDGATLFFDDDDRCHFCLLLQQCIERYACRVHAYCLMSNHVHLALQVGTIPLSRIMQNLSFRYTRWINWRQKRTGHLFQGRYKAVLVDLDTYLLQLVAYIHKNPVRAGMVEQPADFPWSSHQAYLGKTSLPWLTVGPVLSQFSPKVDRARKLFAENIESQTEDVSFEKRCNQPGGDSRVFGDDTFVDQVMRKAGEEWLVRPGLDEVLRVVEKVCRISSEELRRPGQGAKLSETRALLAWAVSEHSDATLTELGQWLGRDVTTLSSAVRRLREKAKKSEYVVETQEQIMRLLDQFATLQA